MALDLSNYVDVAQRLRMMHERWPDLRLQESPPQVVTVGQQQYISVTITAWRTPDDPLPAVATAWEPWPGTTPYTRNSEMMNAATSALGRCANLLMPIGKSLASLEEVMNRRMDGGPAIPQPVEPPHHEGDEYPWPEDAQPAPARPQLGSRARIESRNTPGRPTDKQRAAVAAIAKRLGIEPPELDSVAAASEWIKANGVSRD